MGVSPRHTRRMLASCRKERVAAVAHDHRGRRASNVTPRPWSSMWSNWSARGTQRIRIASPKLLSEQGELPAKRFLGHGIS